jgi:hypothetical protein
MCSSFSYQNYDFKKLDEGIHAEYLWHDSKHDEVLRKTIGNFFFETYTTAVKWEDN